MKTMLDEITKIFQTQESDEKIDELMGHLYERYPTGTDPYGLDLRRAVKTVKLFIALYEKYWKVRVFGAENVEDKQYLMVSNHSGQIAIDGVLIVCAFFLKVYPPRILRPMVERFLTKLPFVGKWVFETGSVLGDRENCDSLLQSGESVLVFPEGVRGVAKSTNDFYNLKRFTKGFFRLALNSKVDILPIAVVGAEEFYPHVYHFKPLAKLLGIPALPLFPGMLLGPLGMLPLPSPVDIYIGRPYKIPEDLSPDSPEKDLDPHIEKIVMQIEEMICIGRKNRRQFWANKDVE